MTIQINRKICLLGMYATGKTSLIRRYVHNIFDEKYLSTIGVNVSQKLLPPLETSNNKIVQFNFLIWDIEGIDRNNKLQKNYYAGSSGAIVVGDLTRKESFEVINGLLSDFSTICPEALIVLAGNKKDLLIENTDHPQRLKELAAQKKADYLLTSAKTGENVDELFLLLAHKIKDKL
ncbi:MAG TPA: Rab family GTPase [bacterium]|nr:Rab family GTPase [bacterium]HPN43480.1 Rab family GTPase [bacterium]